VRDLRRDLRVPEERTERVGVRGVAYGVEDQVRVEDEKPVIERAVLSV
jgi:hypothetical protein